MAVASRAFVASVAFIAFGIWTLDWPLAELAALAQTFRLRSLLSLWLLAMTVDRKDRVDKGVFLC